MCVCVRVCVRACTVFVITHFHSNETNKSLILLQLDIVCWHWNVLIHFMLLFECVDAHIIILMYLYY